MSIFIIERIGAARADALVVPAYVMSGFFSITEAIETWQYLSQETSLKRVNIYTQEEYAKHYTCHPIALGEKALLVTKTPEGVYTRGILPLMLKMLCKESIVLVDILKDKAHDMIFSADEMIHIREVNDAFTKNVLLGRDNVGTYIHSIRDDESLVEFALTTKANGNAGIILLYDDVSISQMQRIENKLWHIPHESIAVTKFATLQILIVNDASIKLRKIGEGDVSSIRLGEIFHGVPLSF